MGKNTKVDTAIAETYKLEVGTIKSDCVTEIEQK